MKDIKLFFEKYNIKTTNPDIYIRAFTHSSFNSDANTHHLDYERLEFMGDSVLGFVIASLLYKEHPEMREGDLTKSKSFLVQTNYLAKLATRENYGDFIRAGHSLTVEAAIHNKSILEDIFEAVIGAMYLDQGIEFTSNFIKKIYGDDVKNFTLKEIKDFKSILQEAMQAEYRRSVEYVVVDEKGPSNDKTFTVEVRFNDLTLGRGVGKSKKAAEQKAAEDALKKKATL